MPNLEILTRDIEQGIAKHSANGLQDFVKEMQSWKQHGATTELINKELAAVNQKLHHDGYLPGLNLVGFEKGENGKLIVNKSGTHELLLSTKISKKLI